jgi:serine/threonine-protein kinase
MVLLGRYDIEAQLGIGGCSIVLRARDRLLDQTVAIKILRTDVGFALDMEARLMREARAIAQLSSEHVVRILDVGALDSGAPFLIMELLRGTDLDGVLKRQRLLPPGLAVDYILQACDAFAEAHARGIVHRDIKPSNLFVVSRSDGAKIVKVLDFGISKSTFPDGDLSLTQTASVLGTPAYMAPEQMRSARFADERSDVWALGTVLYQLVEGRQPLHGETFADLVVAATTLPHDPMTMAPQLAPVIARCLAKSPRDRYANMAELAAALEGFTTGEIGRACVARSARVLGIAPLIPLPIATSNLAAATPAPRVLPWRIAIIAAMVAAIAIPVTVLIARGHEPDTGPSDQPAAIGPPAVAPPAVAPPAVAPATTPPEPAAAAPPRPAEPTPAPVAAPSRTVEPSAAPGPSRAAVPTAASPGAAPAPARSSTAKPAAPAKPAVRKKPRPTDPGCDPYSRPEGC